MSTWPASDLSCRFGTCRPLRRWRHGRWWKAPFVIAVISAFLLIDVMGLCNTYGILGFA